MRKAAVFFSALVAVLLLYEPCQADPQEHCRCLNITFNDGSTGRTIGACKSQDRSGSFWCFVEAESGCEDKKPDDRHHGLYKSAIACTEEGEGWD